MSTVLWDFYSDLPAYAEARFVYTGEARTRPINHTYDPPGRPRRTSREIARHTVNIRDARRTFGLGFESLPHRDSLGDRETFLVLW
jgi:hypothetical protein